MKEKMSLLALSALVLIPLVSCDPVSSVTSSSTSSESSVTTSLETSVNTSEDTSKNTSESSLSEKSSVSTLDAKIVGLQHALEKSYDNITVESVSTMIGDMSYEGEIEEINVRQHEIDKIISNKEYMISYDDSSDAEYDTYVRIGDTHVNIYDELSDGTFSNTKITMDEWEKVLSTGAYKYAYAYLAYTSPVEFDLSVNDVTVVNDELFVKNDIVQTLGYSILDLEEDDGAEIVSIKIEVADDAFSKIVISYKYDTNEMSVNCEYSVSFSNIGTTTFTYPNVPEQELVLEEGPEHVDLSTCVSLNDEQKVALDAVLNTNYVNFKCDYFNDYNDGYYSIYETDYIDGDKYYVDYYGSQFYGMYTTSSIYYLVIDDSECYTLELTDEKTVAKNVIEDQETLYDYYPYAITPNDVKYSTNFTSSDFVKANDANIYCLSQEALSRYSSLVVSSGSTLSSFEIELDDDGTLLEMRYISYEEDLDGVYYDYSSFAYYDIGTTEIVLPEVGYSALSDLDELQKTELQNAINADYSNATIFEEICYVEMYYVGDTSYLVSIDEETYDYVITEVVYEDGKYYEKNGNNKVEITEADYVNRFVTISEEAIDYSLVKYNSFTGTYYVSIDDIDLQAFIPYYNDADFLSTVKGVEFVVSNGKIGKINLEYEGDDGLVLGTGFEIYDVGETEAPSLEDYE